MAMQRGDSFSRMLEDVGLRREEPPQHVRPRPVGNPGYQIQFVADASQPVTAETLGGLYIDELVFDAEAMVASAPPSTSTDPAEIAAELAVTEAMDADALHRLRRSFALANHPDRLAVTYRETATRRMMIANQLIDSALARRHWR